MAVLRLEAHRGELPDLPAVCMKCGAPAALRKPKQFSWYPPWVAVLLLAGILPYVIVALILTKRRTVDVPLCQAHKNHWLWRTLVLLFSVIGLVALGFLAVAADNLVKPRRSDLSGLLCTAAGVGGIAWVILAVVLQATAIRVKAITDFSITLAGVSEDFIGAYETEVSRVAPLVDRAARDYWGQHRHPRPARDVTRPPPDEFQEGAGEA